VGDSALRQRDLYCEQAGPTWTWQTAGIATLGFEYNFTSLPCDRVYVLVGMAAPYAETVAGQATGQVLTIRFRS
jgi:hypothetical protein